MSTEPSRIRIEGVPVLVAEGTAPGAWWEESLRQFKASVGQRQYPCHFGRLALARGELSATFLSGSTQPLAQCLSWFLEMSREHLERRMVLAAFCEPLDPAVSEQAYAERFWRILQDLHDADDTEWPVAIPRHPEHAAWEFSFHGVPMFVFAAAPTYLRRASRNVGPGLVLLFQPRNVFDGIEGGTPRGMAARHIIRDRLDHWDTVPPHPDMGDYGDPANNEWRQYFVPDDQSRLHEKCPLHIKGADAAANPTPQDHEQVGQP
jgi:FPC/CPF motif-containing protein YcgG